MDVRLSTKVAPKFTPDGLFLWSGTQDFHRGAMALWSARTGSLVGVFKYSKCSYQGVLAHTLPEAVVLVNPVTSEEIARLPTDQYPSYFAGDGTYLVTKSADGARSRLWRVADGMEVRPNYEASSFTFDDDNSPSMVAMLSLDRRSVSVWDLVMGRESFRARLEALSVAVAFHWPYLLTYQIDRASHVWDLRTGEHLCRLNVDWYYDIGPFFAPDRRDPRRALVDMDDFVYVYDVALCRPIVMLGYEVSARFGDDGRSVEVYYPTRNLGPVIRTALLPSIGL